MNLNGAKAPSVIVVEDNETLRDELVLYLSEEGFAVRGVGSGAELNQAIEACSADILILDLNLPEEDGISITRRIRSALPTVGIILLTARVRSTDRMEGYANGADVYLTKPTRPEELVAVVKNLFARLGVRPSPTPWQLDMSGCTLHSPTELLIELTANEARLLMALSVNGQFLDHATLLSRFGDESQTEKTNKARLEVLISRLRTKLGPHIHNGFDIRAVRGQGYQLGFVLAVKNLTVAPS
ncbi:MAG: response regulator transcription factor [Rhodoferax sp.]|uniref:response regulator transcription factor n=1 Tax=Rhodoferax sp. TaxID=50421 RepID=UPI0026263BEA|nr:response regulator transcription factor [Rhodoferax sp.]MDD2880837.1 response regulator transcription factor [Rhodoferax sp.]